MKRNNRILAAFFSICMGLVMAFTTASYAGDFNITYKNKVVASVPGPKSVAGIKRDGSGAAVIKIAKSQNGYYPGASVRCGGINRRISYYGNIWANNELGKNCIDGNSPGNWCSEFASWCIRQAGVAKNLCPAQEDTKSFKNYFTARGRFFKFSKSTGRAARSGWFSGHSSAGTLRPSDLRPGDILQINDKKTNDGIPNHTAIFVKLSGNNKVYTYDGNKDVGGKRKVKAGCTYTYSQVIAVIRPQYSDNLSVSVTREGKNNSKVRVHVSGLGGAFSGKQYLITISDTDIRNYVTAYDRKTVLYDKSGRFKKNKKYTVTLRVRDTSSGRTDNTFPAVKTSFTY